MLALEMAGREKLNGKWKFHSSEDFEAYMKELGINFAIRKLAKLAKPDVVMEIKGDDVLYKSISTARTTEIKCKIDEDFVEHQPNGIQINSRMTWDGDKLVHKQTWDGKESVVTRYVDDEDKFVMEFAMNKALSKRTFTRQK